MTRCSSELASGEAVIVINHRLQVWESAVVIEAAAQAIESITSGWLSSVVFLGIATQLAVGAGWVDSLAALAIVYFLIKEGREAWAGDECSGTGL